MVCVANEVKVECVVQDGTNKSVSNVFMLPASTTTEDLYKTLFAFHKCEPDSFVLLLQTYQAKNTVELTRSRDTTLLQLEPNCLNQTTTILMKATDQPPKHSIPLAPPIFVSDNASLFPDDDSPPPLATDPEDQITRKNTIFRGSDAYKRLARENKYCSNDPSLNQTVDFISNHPEKNYVGLVNQAMTCYLNSLLQALYMTPEFRNALYNWEYVDGSEKEEAMSIPYQLQKLFLNLQTSTKPAVETTSLTKSFGWDSTEAWQQHDIQELCRVMFDALETKFKDTEQADLINRLYEGKMIDYVKCLECKTEKSREDTFLDIPLPVRPFESNTAYGSVEEALRAFVKYETLDGNNQYYCEKCNKKCDAHKGLKFTKFPYLLTLHLKRFDFDYNTLYRIKLNDKVTFPHVLDLNSFIATTPNQESPNQESSNGEDDVGMSIKCDDSSTTDSGTLEDECLPCDGAICTNNHSGNHDQEDDEGIDMSNGVATSNGIAHNHENEKKQGKFLKDQGPYVYELFSIMIHSGSASGGHYYAYIKDFTTSQWLCFNDTTVNPITHNDIQKVYGGGPLRAYSSSTNAYMLMYRQIDKTKNAVPIQEEHFPQHIQALLKKMKEIEDDDRRYHSRHSPTYKIKIYCHHPKTKKLMTNKLNTIGESTWAEQTEKAYEKFGLHGDVNLDQCRLVFYDPLNDLITHSYDGSDEDSMYEVFKGDKRNDLLLEIREKDLPFEAYKPEGIATKVYVIDVPQADIIDGPISVRGYQAETVREYKQQLAKIVNIDPDEMNLVAMVFSQYHLLQDDKTLEAESLDVHGEHKVYVSLMFDTDFTEASKNTASEVPSLKLLSVIESLEKVIWIHVQLPEVNKEVIEDLNIPSLENESKQENSKHPPNGQMEVNVKDEICSDELSEKKSVKVSANGSKFATLVLDDKIESSQHVGTTTVKWQAGLESTSEDSSLSDSEKTLVDDSSGSYNNHHSRFYDDSKFNKFYQSFVNSESDEESDHYFKGTPCSSEENEKLLRVLVDKRMRLETLKKKLERFVGVPVDYFNVYYQSADSPEAECTDFKANLKLYNDGARFSIKLGRALRKGELKVKLYQLHLDCAEEPFKFMFDWIIAKNMTVAQAKEEILAELKRKYDLEIPFQRFRLRKKSNKVASMVLLNTSRFEDLTISSQDEVIVQELPEDETVTEPKQLVLFVRKWSRSTLQLGAIQEVVLTGRAISELKEKINFLSNIPEENIDIAKGKGSFPCESMSLLNVENDLDWKVKVTEVDKWPLDLEDGSVVLYRDSREILKQLNPEEKREFTNKENSRLLSLGTTPSYSSPRREKALKIYLDSK